MDIQCLPIATWKSWFKNIFLNKAKPFLIIIAYHYKFYLQQPSVVLHRKQDCENTLLGFALWLSAFQYRQVSNLPVYHLGTIIKHLFIIHAFWNCYLCLFLGRGPRKFLTLSCVILRCCSTISLSHFSWNSSIPKTFSFLPTDVY